MAWVSGVKNSFFVKVFPELFYRKQRWSQRVCYGFTLPDGGLKGCGIWEILHLCNNLTLYSLFTEKIKMNSLTATNDFSYCEKLQALERSQTELHHLASFVFAHIGQDKVVSAATEFCKEPYLAEETVYITITKHK